MKFQFPRHLFTPFLIYDAVNSASPPPPPPPPPPVWANVRLDPVVSYVQQVFLRSVATNSQLVVAINDFQLQTVGNAKVTINGTLSVNSTIKTDVQSKIIIDETVVNQMRTDLPPLFANILVPSGVSNTSELFYKLQTSVNQVVTVENIQNIIQATFDSNKGKMYIRDSIVIFDSDLEVSQNISTKVVAVNVIKSIVDVAGDLSSVPVNAPPSKNPINWLAFAVAVGSSVMCLILFLVVIVTIANGRSTKRR